VNQRGKVNFVAVLMLAGLIGAGWWAYTFGPIYFDNAEVKQLTQTYVSRATSLQERGDIDLSGLYLNALNQIGSHEETDPSGKRVEKRGLGVTKENITFKKDQVTGIATVGVTYSRTFQLKPLQKWKTLNFTVMKESPFK
jgi:hypothetical protein